MIMGNRCSGVDTHLNPGSRSRNSFILYNVLDPFFVNSRVGRSGVKKVNHGAPQSNPVPGSTHTSNEAGQNRHPSRNPIPGTLLFQDLRGISGLLEWSGRLGNEQLPGMETRRSTKGTEELQRQLQLP
jgi:hypothetical protein